MKIVSWKKIIILILTLALLTPLLGGFLNLNFFSQAAAQDYKSIEYEPQIQLPVPGSGLDQESIKVGTVEGAYMTSDLLAKYIKAIYDYGIMIAGILAAIVLMGGGILWLTSAGNDSRITQAKELIIGSVSGLAILFASWILLNTINPELLEMKVIKTKIIEKIEFGCCESHNEAFVTTEVECKTPAKFFKEGKMPNIFTNKCETPGCCIGRTPQSNVVSYECAPSFKNNCTLGEYKEDACNNVCPEYYKIVTCQAGSDGELCHGSTSGHCYGGVCWYGKGEKDEPCGNEIGSKCMNFNLLTMGCPSGYTWDAGGGRDCNPLLLTCCHPSPSE